MRQDSAVSYADLERLGWPQFMIDDYMGRLRDLTPQRGAQNPEGVYAANLNGMYINTASSTLWFNPSPGELTGWIAL